MPYTLRYHPRVAEDDLPDIPANLHARLARAIEGRLTAETSATGCRFEERSGDTGSYG